MGGCGLIKRYSAKRAFVPIGSIVGVGSGVRGGAFCWRIRFGRVRIGIAGGFISGAVMPGHHQLNAQAKPRFDGFVGPMEGLNDQNVLSRGEVLEDVITGKHSAGGSANTYPHPGKIRTAQMGDDAL